MDDESGESMELMGEMALKELGLWGRIGGISAWLTEESRFQRRGEAYWKERSVIRKEDDMWTGERVWPKMTSECCEEAELWWGYADMKVGWLWELCR